MLDQPILFDYGQNVRAAPTIPAELDGRQADHGRRGHGDDGLRYRVVGLAPLGRGGIDGRRRPAAARSTSTLNRLLLVEGLVIAGVLLVLAARRAGSSCASGCGRSTASATPPGAIAGGDLSHRVDVDRRRAPRSAALGLALNAMLDRLEEAFAERQASEDRLRQFLADASHELRTPLASIRGYAELFRMGAARDPRGRREGDAADRGRGGAHGRARRGPADARAARRGARRAARARSTSPQLARDAVADARATAPDRAIAVDADGPAVVLGDAAPAAPGARQPAAQRARPHAGGHADRGRPSAARTARCALEVRDHGPGLPTDDPNALFERFWRAEGGRERGKAGAGLGLAIVAGIVDAHGGRVSAANADGGGAAFVVTLPAA